VGIVGGVYGIGGGSIIAPFFVSFCGLPVYTVAGAALMGTFVTSIAEHRTGCLEYFSVLVACVVCILGQGAKNMFLQKSLNGCSEASLSLQP